MSENIPAPSPEPRTTDSTPSLAEWQAKHEAAGPLSNDGAAGTRPILPGGWVSYTDFVQWSWKNPEGVRHWCDFMARLEGGEPLDLSPKMQAEVKRFVAFRKQGRAMEAARVKNEELVRLLLAPPPGGDMDEKTRQLKKLCDEWSDILLDVPEPIRGKYLSQLTPLREQAALLIAMADEDTQHEPT